MSTFAVKVTRIKAIEPIENADNIELAVVGDYRAVVLKGEFKAGQLAVYIPEASMVPVWLLECMGLVGKLAGSGKNRVKAIKLRGCLSQGLLYVLRDQGPGVLTPERGVLDYYADEFKRTDSITVWEGDNVTPYLGITKYEPAIPAYMNGDLYNAGTEITVNYDIENVKGFPDVLVPGEEVVMTEKIHGTFCGVGILPEKDWDDKHYLRKFVVFSKGQGAKGLCFTASERSLSTVYFRALLKIDIFNKLTKMIDWYRIEQNTELETPLFVLGEVYGQNVQDLAYGSSELSFRAFDILTGYRGEQVYYNHDAFTALTDNMLQVERVPLVYRGPFSKETLISYSGGCEAVSGNSVNIREGVVVKPIVERRDLTGLGRVILKSLGEEYLLRKGGTEYN